MDDRIGRCIRSRARQADTALAREDLTTDWLFADARGRFGLGGGRRSVDPRTIGAELELLPVHALSHLPVSIIATTEGKAASLNVVRSVSSAEGWNEIAMGIDPPAWMLPTGSRISFEPGGQLEISSAAHTGVSSLVRELSSIVSGLVVAFEKEGITLEAKGVDPWNDIARVPLQLHRARYAGMTRYFDSIGPSGARMMRQTSSIQVNVEAGSDPLVRWHLLSRLAPFLLAMFANSSHYAGQPSAHRSHRAHLWRTLDPSRTGLPAATGNPVEGYLGFALKAGAMFGPVENGRYCSFNEWMASGKAGRAEWDLHLSTLFPEVRPKGYFEVRSPDVVDPAWLAAPIAMIAGIVYDDETERAVRALLPPCDLSLLELAGRVGLGDANIRRVATEIGRLALHGCESLGRDYLSATDLDTAAAYLDRYVENGKSPADDS